MMVVVIVVVVVFLVFVLHYYTYMLRVRIYDNKYNFGKGNSFNEI